MDDRRKYIGGSDAGAIAGLNPYATPLDVYMEKTAEVEIIKPENQRMKAGKRLEGVVADWFSEETKTKIRNVERPFVSELNPFIIGHIDRAIVPTGVLEVKTTQKSVLKRAQEDGWDVPPWWWAQLQHYFHCTGWSWGAFAILLDGHEFQSIHIEANPEFIDKLIGIEVKFWYEHVIPRVPPAPVNAADVMKLFPRSVEAAIVNADDTTFAAFIAYRDAKRKIDAITEELESNEEIIKMAMKDAEVLLVDGKPAITWKSSRDSKVFDKDTFAKENPDMYSKYLVTRPGSRRFIIKK